MNIQEQFDAMVVHLRKQNKKSLSTLTGGLPAYHGDNGSMCAVGFLIPGSLYSEDMEGLPSEAIIDEYGLDIDIDLAERMQRLHDDSPVSTWEAEFKKVAHYSELKLTKKGTK